MLHSPLLQFSCRFCTCRLIYMAWNSKEIVERKCSVGLHSIRLLMSTHSRGVARGGGGGYWGACDPPLVGLLLNKQPTIFRWRKRHDNILAVKAIVEKPTFLKFVFL